jgi:hypothetical protein
VPSHPIACHDVFEREASLTVHRDGARIVLVAPAPNSAHLDWRGVEELIAELIKLRNDLPGTPS